MKDLFTKIKNFKSLSKFSLGLFTGILGTSLVFSGIVIASDPIKLIVNGQQIQCDVPPQNINGRVLVPARFVAEPLGATVEWDGVNKAVIINSNQQNNVVTPPTDNIVITPEKDNPKPPVDSRSENVQIDLDKDIQEFLNAKPPQIPDQPKK